MKKFVIRPLLISLITLVLLEGALRIYHWIHPSFIFVDDSKNYRFRGIPFDNALGFTLNSKGFLDVEYPQAKDSNTTRIIGLGDSFTFGVVPYELNFLTLLENKFDDNTEVINMGIPGTSLSDYFLLLAKEGLQYNPDIVLCCFFIGNDFSGKVSVQPDPFFVYSYFNYLINVVPNAIIAPLYEYEVYDDNQPTLDGDKYLNIELERSKMCSKDFKGFAKRLDDVMTLMNQMNDLCQDKGSELVIVIIPDELQVDSTLQSMIKETHTRYKPESFDFDLPNRLLTQKLDQHNIKYVDLLPEFRKSSQDARLYKPQDTHWNIAGNALASKLIYEGLNEQ